VTLKISLNDDLRRLSVTDITTYSLNVLHETLRKLFALNEQQFARFSLKYVDDEGDLVTITSSEELAEALEMARRAQPAILRLQLKEKEERAPHQPGFPMPPFGFIPPWARRFAQGGNGTHQQGGRCGGMRRWANAEQLDAMKKAKEEKKARKFAALPQTLEDSRHQHPLYLVQDPYGHGNFVCDGCNLPGRRFAYHCGHCNYDLHVSCDKAKAKSERMANKPWARRRRWFQLHHEAMALLETPTAENLAKAKSLFEEQLATSPFHQATPLYNLACVESLQGNSGDALSRLQEAVNNGWKDAAHTEADKDFDNIRQLDGFKALIAAMKADQGNTEGNTDVKEEKKREKREKRQEAKRQPEAPKPEVKPEAAPLTPIYPQLKVAAPAPATPQQTVIQPAPVEPAQPAVPSLPTQSSSIAEFDEKLKTLESMGFVDRRKNISVLVRTRGDLVAAIQQLLEEAGQIAQ